MSKIPNLKTYKASSISLMKYLILAGIMPLPFSVALISLGGILPKTFGFLLLSFVLYPFFIKLFLPVISICENEVAVRTLFGTVKWLNIYTNTDVYIGIEELRLANGGTTVTLEKKWFSESVWSEIASSIEKLKSQV